MDEEERTATKIIRILLEASVLSFAGAGAGGLLLGPEGLALGAAVAGGMTLLTNRNRFASWNDLQAARNWSGLVALTLKVAAKLLIQNWDMLYKIAINIARILSRYFNANQPAPITQ